MAVDLVESVGGKGRGGGGGRGGWGMSSGVLKMPCFHENGWKTTCIA